LETVEREKEREREREREREISLVIAIIAIIRDDNSTGIFCRELNARTHA